MNKNILEISPKYIVDSSGKKKEVVLDILTFEKILEKLEDLYFCLKAEQAFKQGKFAELETTELDEGWLDFHEAEIFE